MTTLKWIWLIIIAFHSFSCQNMDEKQVSTHSESVLQPYADNPRYWEYKGKPVLLLGASNNDNLFQSVDFPEQLDELSSIEGNFIRLTMSSRDSGDVWPFYQEENGLYDLEKWNDVYWERFERLLTLSAERDIIVQIELWDRFDFSREPWQLNPFNPANNINYSEEACGMSTDYPKHPSSDLQPFFHSIPGMPNYSKKLDIVRAYQEKLIDKLLSYSFTFDHVLYCMNNETSSPVEWGKYWMAFVNKKSQEKGKKVFVTDMYDHFFKPQSCRRCQDLIADPEQYTFIDASQINSRNFGQTHWDTLQWIINYRDQFSLRPLNNTKVYGGNNSSWGSGSNEDGVARFCRDVLGGVAAVRHHRPPSGNGLNEKAKANIKAFRQVEKFMSFWDLKPYMELLDEREEDEAYLVGNKGKKYLLYVPKEAEILLDLKEFSQAFQLKWLDISGGELGEEAVIQGGDWVQVKSPGLGELGWLAIIYL